VSDTIVMPPLGETAEAKRTPTVYFIDDSATMREVIKIAFRRESINVVTCADAASAISQFDENPPDVVITDVIMPDQDGYSVCSHIKQSERFSKTPVILMSGVVNKNVADRAVAVQADELVRKPFQPQELLGRVKTLLGHTAPAPAHSPRDRAAAPSLSSLFAPPAQQQPSTLSGQARPANVTPMPFATQPAQPAAHSSFAAETDSRTGENVWPRALADAFMNQVAPNAPASQPANPGGQSRPSATASDVHKFRAEIARLELLIKKLQTELQIERQYNQALEMHVRTLTQVD
jgi:DNA-binding response OmpR family regulator